ncbi:MAG TPA: hypothetical protein PKM25_17975, partial [Candidatus Ozemobacteraceae bacterium]|nr:hypothetical protein [Candidatus Ozemobacteraceae bacterium]
SPLEGSATIILEPLPVKRLMELAGKHLPPMPDIKIDEGRLGGEVRFTLAGGEMKNVSAWARPQGLVVRHSRLPAPIRLAQGALRYDNGRLDWEKLAADIRGISIKSDRGNALFGKKTSGLAEVSVKLDLSVLTGDLKKFVPETVLRMKPEGNAEFTGKIEVDGSDVGLTGELQGEKIRAIPSAGMAPVRLDRIRLALNRVNAGGGTIEIRECQADTLGMALNLRGSVKNGSDPAFDLEASATADLATVKNALPIENDLFKKQARISGIALLQAHIGGTLKKPQPSGRLELKGVGFELVSKGVRATGVSGVAEVDPRQITIERLNAVLVGGKLALSGALSDYLGKPQVNASGTLQGADLAEIRSLIGGNVQGFPAELAFNGRADLDVAVKGSAAEPNISGNAVLTGAGLSHPALLRPLTGIVGPIRFDQKGLTTEGLQLAWGSSTVRLVGRMEDWSGFKLAFQYDVQPLDMTDIGAFFLAGTGYRAEGSG